MQRYKSAKSPLRSSGATLIALVTPRQHLIDPALLVANDDGGERIGQVGMWIDGIEFTGLDQGTSRPDFLVVRSSNVVSMEKLPLLAMNS